MAAHAHGVSRDSGMRGTGSSPKQRDMSGSNHRWSVHKLICCEQAGPGAPVPTCVAAGLRAPPPQARTLRFYYAMEVRIFTYLEKTSIGHEKTRIALTKSTVVLG
jgi:hypothetical protein